jgi:membrane protein DedA with SNARE-associated domain
MEQLVNTIIDYLLPKNDIFLYIFLFLSSIIENLFPPIPGDTITVFGAFLVGIGRLNYALVFLFTTAGSVVGFMILAILGRFISREFFIKRNYKFFSAASIVSAEAWFERYGFWVVLANRFLPGIRSVVSLVSGITKLRLLHVFFLSLASAAIWNLLWIQVGFVLGNNWQTVRNKIAYIFAQYNIAACIVIVVAAAGFIGYRFFKRRKCAPDKN